MIRYLTILTFYTFLFFGCNSKKENKNAISKQFVARELPALKAEEEYSDSLKIGVSGKYKIDFKKFRTDDSVYVVIKFYEKKSTKWNLKQTFNFLKDGVLSCDPEFKDFNNDQLNDFTFQSSIAGRGANTIRKLFLFDKQKGELIFIKNSEDFPNLRYNKNLDCIDAFRVYGGTQTAFAKIEKDSLREFANVEIFDERIIINTIDKNGKKETLRNKKFLEDSYIRFENYAPLKEYEGED